MQNKAKERARCKRRSVANGALIGTGDSADLAATRALWKYLARQVVGRVSSFARLCLGQRSRGEIFFFLCSAAAGRHSGRSIDGLSRAQALRERPRLLGWAEIAARLYGRLSWVGLRKCFISLLQSTSQEWVSVSGRWMSSQHLLRSANQSAER